MTGEDYGKVGEEGPKTCEECQPLGQFGFSKVPCESCSLNWPPHSVLFTHPTPSGFTLCQASHPSKAALGTLFES